MGTNYTRIVAELIVFCYERDFCLTIFKLMLLKTYLPQRCLEDDLLDIENA